MVNQEEQVSFYGEIIRIQSEPTKARKGDYRFSGVELTGDLPGSRTFIIFPEFSGEDFFLFPQLCWLGARLSARNLSLNNSLDDGSMIFCVNPESELVLEPFRPVSVIEAIDSFKCIKSIDLRYRLKSGEPYWLAKGKAIHTMFDQLVRNPIEDLETLFDRSFTPVVREFVQTLPGSSTWVTYSDFRQELRRHYKNLATWLSNNLPRPHGVDTEQDRLSVRYGLKGRTDAVFYSDSGATIVEVKSGKFISDEHLMQLYAYDLMIREDDGLAGIDSHVVYSSTGLSRTVDELGNNLTRSILHGRNVSVALKRFYAFGDNLCDTQLFSQCEIGKRCHSRANCDEFYGSDMVFGKVLSPVQKKYYDSWFGLICIDEWYQESEFANILDKSTLNERLKEGITIPVDRVTVDSNPKNQISGRRSVNTPKSADPFTDMPFSEDEKSHSLGPVSVTVESAHGFGDITSGDEIIVHRGDVCSQDSLRARVSEMTQGRLKLTTRTEYSPFLGNVNRSDLDGEKLYLDKVPFLRAREMSRKSLMNFLTDASPQIVATVVESHSGYQRPNDSGPTGILETDSRSQPDHNPGAVSRGESTDKTGKHTVDFRKSRFSGLNDNQRQAVWRSIEAPVYHLIHGPPGTGKTRVLSGLIVEMIRSGLRILVSCPTNVALDRVLIALLKDGFTQFIRLGGRNNCSVEFLQMADAKGGSVLHLDQLAANTRDFEEFKAKVRNTGLIGATAYQCASNPVFLKERFDVVVIDEAGQLDEPSSLAPLSLAEKFVMCGDHLQLPPVVKSRNPDSGDTREGLEVSLFERLFRCSIPGTVSSLNVQYRMNDEVQSITSKLFYGGKLVAAPEVAKRRLNVGDDLKGPTYIRQIIDPETPVVFVDVHGGSDSGKARPEEADLAVEIAEALVGLGIPSSEIGIITPYRAQQALIRQRMADMTGLHRISVDTVDRFQGGEKEVILMSLARSDSVTSFLADPKRLNVSLSRARSKLILLGREAALEAHPLFQAMFSGLKKVVIKN